MFYRFVFRNTDNGEMREAIATSFCPAARSLGIPLVRDVNGDKVLTGPWWRWECWSAQGECLWNFDEAGEFRLGSRLTKP
jgi:L-2-hydroxyglutarate oxidase LhgO